MSPCWGCRSSIERMTYASILPRPQASLSIPEIIEYYTMPEPNSGCLLWLGPTLGPQDRPAYRYGTFDYNKIRYAAHRVSWELANFQRVPAGKVMMHKCDNTYCVAPQHLTPGTQAENIADAARKGRVATKLTAEIVTKIRLSPLGRNAAADKFGVSWDAISKIRNGKIWRHVPMPENMPRRAGRGRPPINRSQTRHAA